MGNESTAAGNSAPEVIRFAPFALDLRAAELRKHGVKVRLPQQSFQILAMLLGRHPDVVLRDEIRASLWPDGTIVEFDHSINAAVKNLRAALGDSAESPRFVETVGRQGYRFVGELERQTAGATIPVAVPPAAADAPPAAVESSGHWRVAAIRVSAVIAVGAVAAAGLSWWLSPSREADFFEPVPLTTYLGEKLDPSLSPSGDQVAFSWRKKPTEPRQLHVKLVGPGPPLQLTFDEGNHAGAAWSPDGKWIALVGYHFNGERGVYLVPALGGPERLLAKDSEVTSLSWSPDGKWLFAGPTPALPDLGVVLFSTQTGERIELGQQYPEMRKVSSPRVSPDGTRLAFLSGNLFASQIRVVNLNADLRPVGKPKQVTFDELGAIDPEWTPDGREIVFRSGFINNGALKRVVPDGRGQARKVLGAGIAAGRVTIARNGRLVFGRGGDDWDIVRYDLRGAKEPVRWASSTRYENNAAYSPDGRRIAMSSSRSGTREIWVTDSEGGNEQKLTDFSGPITGTPRWSPDGKWIAFDSRPEGDAEVFVIEAAGSGRRRITNQAGEDARPAWSPDGKWIYFASERTGRLEIWRAPSAGGNALRVTRDGGTAVLAAPDGEWIYYTQGWSRPSAVRKIRPDGSGDSSVLEPATAPMGFTFTSRGLWFIQYGSTTTVELLSFADGRRSKILDLTFLPDNGLSLSPDERYLLLCRPDERGTDLVYIDNFK